MNGRAFILMVAMMLVQASQSVLPFAAGPDCGVGVARAGDTHGCCRIITEAGCASTCRCCADAPSIPATPQPLVPGPASGRDLVPLMVPFEFAAQMPALKIRDDGAFEARSLRDDSLRVAECRVAHAILHGAFLI